MADDATGYDDSGADDSSTYSDDSIGGSYDDQSASYDQSGGYDDQSGGYGDSSVVETAFHIPFIDCDEVCHVYYPESGDPAGWCGSKCTYSKGHAGLHHCHYEHMWPTGYNPDRWDKDPDSPLHPHVDP